MKVGDKVKFKVPDYDPKRPGEFTSEYSAEHTGKLVRIDEDTYCLVQCFEEREYPKKDGSSYKKKDWHPYNVKKEWCY